MKSFDFVGNAGLKIGDLENKSPYDFFCLFANDDFYELLVTETNKQGQNLMNKSTKSKSRINKWTDVSISEMKVFLGLLFHMGHIQLPRVTDYWRTDDLFNLKCFSNSMSRNRFMLIMRCLHYASNTEENASGNRLYKIQPLLDHFHSVMDNIYYPSKELSIDESMILWRGRLIFRQFMKDKRHKYGVKLYQLTEPKGTYGCCNKYR